MTEREKQDAILSIQAQISGMIRFLIEEEKLAREHPQFYRTLLPVYDNGTIQRLMEAERELLKVRGW